MIQVTRLQLVHPVSFAGKEFTSLQPGPTSKDAKWTVKVVENGVHVTCEGKDNAGTLFIPWTNVQSMSFTPAPTPAKNAKG